MAAKYWIKLYHEVLDDPKMGRLPDHVWRRVIELFLLAGEYDKDGELPPLGDMVWKLRTTEEQLTADLDVIIVTGIVTFRDNMYHVSNFAKRQAAVNPAERQRRHRERIKKDDTPPETPPIIDEKPPDSHEPVTNCDTDTDTDTDIKRLGAKAPPAPPEAPKKPKHLERQELQKYFLARTGLPCPRVDTDAQRRAAQKLWWSPLDEILALVDKDIGRAKIIIDKSLVKLDGVTVADPNSIIKTARAVYAKNGSSGASAEHFAEEH